MLLLADQEDLKRSLAKAEKHGYKNKAKALKFFISEREIYERKTKNSKRDMVRERPLSTVRSSRDRVWA